MWVHGNSHGIGTARCRGAILLLSLLMAALGSQSCEADREEAAREIQLEALGEQVAEFQTEARTRLHDVERRIERLGAIAEEMSGAAREDLEARIERLRAGKKDLERRLESLDGLEDREEWLRVRAEIGDALSTLESAIETAFSEFEEAI